jgi:hypothetical protein
MEPQSMSVAPSPGLSRAGDLLTDLSGVLDEIVARLERIEGLLKRPRHRSASVDGQLLDTIHRTIGLSRFVQAIS